MVPFGRNEVFVGRENVLARLFERIPPSNNKDACQRTILEGLGGIGKTQVALEAAYRVREAYPDCSIFWVPALDLSTFENAYREIGRALEVPGIEDDQADVKAMVKAKLSHDDARHWLMIIDNADDKQLLFTGSNLMSYLPFSREGSIVITTRNHQVAVELDHNIIHLEEMSSEEAKELLHTGLNENQFSDDKGTAQLLEQLSFLPLAIRQASAYMACNSSISVSNYLGYCRSNNDTLIRLLSKGFNDQGRYSSTMNPIAKTWLISFQQISRDNELAAEYLKFICYLGEKNIPMALSPQVEDEITAQEAISILKAYSFIIQRGSLNRFDIHRLVRLAMQNWLQEQGQHRVQIKRVLCRLAEIFPRPDKANREIWTAYMPHVQAALMFQKHYPHYNGRKNLIMNLVKAFARIGRFFEMCQLATSGMGFEDVLVGDPNQDYSADIYTADKGTLIQKCLDAFTSSAGPESLANLSALGGMAFVAVYWKRYAEAEQIYRYIFDQRKVIQGIEHPDVLSCVVELVAVLEAQGKRQESESMLRTLISVQEKLLTSENPAALRCVGGIARELRKHKKHQESAEMLQAVLKQQEKVLGLKHPDVISTMNLIAYGLAKQGKHQEFAIAVQKRLRLEEMAFGSDHLYVLSSMHSTAMGLLQQGQYQEEAEAILRKGLKLAPEVPESPLAHLSALHCTTLLAILLGVQGKPEAEQLYRQAIKLSESILNTTGTTPSTLKTDFCYSLASQGKWMEAEEVLWQALEQGEE